MKTFMSLSRNLYITHSRVYCRTMLFDCSVTGEQSNCTGVSNKPTLVSVRLSLISSFQHTVKSVRGSCSLSVNEPSMFSKRSCKIRFRLIQFMSVAVFSLSLICCVVFCRLTSRSGTKHSSSVHGRKANAQVGVASKCENVHDPVAG